MMKAFWCAVAVLALLPSSAMATPWFDNFDTYAPGSINGQGGWKGWDNVPGAAGIVSADVSLSSPHSQKIHGPADSVHEYAGYTSGQWTYVANLWVPSGGSATTYFIMLNDYNDLGPYSWSVQLPMNLGTGLLNDDMAPGAENIPLIRNAWVPLTFNIDLDNNSVHTFYGATHVSVHPWYAVGDPNDPTAHAAIEAVDLFAWGASPVYYDDMSLIPEPATLVLLVLGGLLVSRRR